MSVLDTHYTRTANAHAPRAALSGSIETETCVIGGGLAGLNTALGLAERGKRVVLLEAKRIAFGASGRNGGFVLPGFSLEAGHLVKRVGLARTRALHELTRAAMALMRQRITEHAIACDAVHAGVVRAWWTDDADAARHFCDEATETMGIAVEFWPRAQLREHLRSARYYDGVFAPESFHLHPLNYALGIAAAAEAKGAIIHEDSPAIAIDPTARTVRTTQGSVRAETLVIACGGYLENLHPKLARAIQPVATHMIATEPLGDRLASAINGQFGIIDSRFDFDYYRPLADTRLLFGAGITVFGEPRDLAARLLRKLLAIYPQLAGIKVETAWSGLMSYAVHQMPQLGEASPGLWYAQGFGGSGLATTTMAGELLASAIAAGDDRYRLLAEFGLASAGGKLGALAFEAAYRWYRMRDRLGW